MNEEEFVACSGIEMWSRVMLAREPFLPQEATAAYIEMTRDERNKLYEASAFVLTDRTLQLYALRIAAKGSETEHQISRWSVPLTDIRVATNTVANDWGNSVTFEEVQYSGTLLLPSATGIFPQSIQLPIDEKAQSSGKARQRVRNFVDAVALAIA